MSAACIRIDATVDLEKLFRSLASEGLDLRHDVRRGDFVITPRPRVCPELVTWLKAPPLLTKESPHHARKPVTGRGSKHRARVSAIRPRTLRDRLAQNSTTWTRVAPMKISRPQQLGLSTPNIRRLSGTGRTRRMTLSRRDCNRLPLSF